MQQKIVLIGGPGTGKTSVLNELTKRGFHCKVEVSREVTLKAQQEGIDQLFLTEPLLFSEKLLEGREQQFLEAEKSTEKLVFFDRGIPDVHAYMNYFNTNYHTSFLRKVIAINMIKFSYLHLGKKFTHQIMSVMKLLKNHLKLINFYKMPTKKLDIV